jgi:hypothetical protein
MSDDDRLYGLPHAEHMESDLDTVYEGWVSDSYASPGPGDELTIEEWTTTPLRHSMPEWDEGILIYETDTDRYLSWNGSAWIVISGRVGCSISISDCVLDDVGMEGARDCVFEAATEEVASAFSVALDLFGSKMIGWRMAAELVASHKITHDADGEPLVDGELMYRPRATDED